MSAERLAIPPPIAAEILAHLRAMLPAEGCGLLAGDAGSGRVDAFHPARNRLASPTAFDLDGEDLVRIVMGIEAAGADLVAVVHSHPRTAAVPSPADLREAAYPVVQLIAGLADPAAGPRAALRAWRYDGTGAREVPIIIG